MPLLILLALLGAACTPLTPIHAGVSTAVMIEDMTEDPDQDAKEQTLLEGVDDIFSAPMNMLKVGLSAHIAFFWSIGDLFLGNEVNFNKRVATLTGQLPMTLSSPTTPPRQLLPHESPGSPFAMKQY